MRRDVRVERRAADRRGDSSRSSPATRSRRRCRTQPEDTAVAGREPPFVICVPRDGRQVAQVQPAAESGAACLEAARRGTAPSRCRRSSRRSPASSPRLRPARRTGARGGSCARRCRRTPWPAACALTTLVSAPPPGLPTITVTELASVFVDTHSAGPAAVSMRTSSNCGGGGGGQRGERDRERREQGKSSSHSLNLRHGAVRPCAYDPPDAARSRDRTRGWTARRLGWRVRTRPGAQARALADRGHPRRSDCRITAAGCSTDTTARSSRPAAPRPACGARRCASACTPRVR